MRLNGDAVIPTEPLAPGMSQQVCQLIDMHTCVIKPERGTVYRGNKAPVPVRTASGNRRAGSL